MKKLLLFIVPLFLLFGVSFGMNYVMDTNYANNVYTTSTPVWNAWLFKITWELLNVTYVSGSLSCKYSYVSTLTWSAPYPNPPVKLCTSNQAINSWWYSYATFSWCILPPWYYVIYNANTWNNSTWFNNCYSQRILCNNYLWNTKNIINNTWFMFMGWTKYKFPDWRYMWFGESDCREQAITTVISWSDPLVPTPTPITIWYNWTWISFAGSNIYLTDLFHNYTMSGSDIIFTPYVYRALFRSH